MPEARRLTLTSGSTRQGSRRLLPATPSSGEMTMPGSRASLPGEHTLMACWSTLARISPGARVVRSSAAVAAVFPSWAPLNNGILLADPDPDTAATTASRLARLFADAHVDSWALWLRSTVTDLQTPDQVREIGGLSRDTTTLVMHASLPRNLRTHEGVARTSIVTATRAGDGEPVPRTRLGEAEDLPGFSAWVMVHDHRAVAGAWSFLHDGDCGIYAVGTSPAWRRQGFARALVEHMLADARRRGARTASLQSTEMGRPLYESLRFEPVGRYEEWLWNGTPLGAGERCAAVR